MDLERWKINAEVYSLKFRSKLKTLVVFAGLALVLVGAYNMLATPFLDTGRIAVLGYIGILTAKGGGAFFLGDVILMVIGAIIVWFL